jgi:superfamily II DNA/RNA helicase
LFGIFNIAIYGGHDKDTQIDNIKQLNNRIDIVIATPGRLIDLMLTNIISLTSVTYLVIDEVDRMLALGFEQQLHIIFQYIRSDKQISLFSATFPGKLRESFSKWMNEDNSVTLRVNTIEMMSHTDFTGNVQSVAIHDSNQNGHGNDNDNEDMGVQKKMDSSNSEMKQQDQSNDEICNNNHNSNTSTLHDDKNVDNNTNNKSDITPSTNESLAPVDTTMLSITISSNVQQHIHVCVPHKKPRLLLRYLLKIQENDKILKLRNNSSVLIFCSKIKTILYLHKFLTNQNITCEKFYGTLDQNVREKVLSNFKAVCRMFSSSFLNIVIILFDIRI